MAILNAGRSTVRFGFALLLSALATLPVKSETAEEYQVKAAYLYNFAKFVEWPPQSFERNGNVISTCILEEDSLADILDKLVKGKEVEGRKFAVRRVSSAAACQTCQILFISNSEPQRFRGVLGALKDAAVLTVAQYPGFAAAGGIINLKLENGRLRFEINVTAAERARIRISSKLLNLAEIVK